MWITVSLPLLPQGVSVDVGALIDLPDDRDRWIASALLVDRPAQSTVRRTLTETARHAAGWLVTLLGATIEQDGAPIEHRTIAMFELEVRGALVRARVAPAAHATWESATWPAVRAALLAAPIRLHGHEVVAIAEIDR